MLRHNESCDYKLSSFKDRNKKLNSKIDLLRIIKTPLLHHLQQTSWQSIHTRRSFRISNFSCYQGWNFSKSKTHQDPISGKKKYNEIQKFISWESLKPLCFIIKSKLHDNPCINEEVLGLQSSLLRYLSGLKFFQVHKRTKTRFFNNNNKILEKKGNGSFFI